MYTNSFLKIMLICLISTIIIEVIVALILRVKNRNDIINIILVNILTNPVVSLFPMAVYLYFGYIYQNIILYFLEILTVLVEGYIYKKHLDYKKINPYLLSLILNLSSYLIGILIGNVVF